MNDIEAAAVDDAFYKRWCSMAHLPNESQSDARRWFRDGAALAHAARGEVECEDCDAGHHAFRIDRDADGRVFHDLPNGQIIQCQKTSRAYASPTPPPATGEAGGKMGPDVLWQHDETGRTQLCHEGVIPGCGWRRVYLLPASKATGEAGTREAEIRKDERERCAKVCEAMADEIAREDIPYHRREERVGAIVREMQSRRVAQTIRALPEAREGGRS